MICKQSIEFIFVNGYAAFFKNILGKVKREAVSIVKLKRILAREHIAVHLINIFFKKCKARVNRFAEGFFLGKDNFADKFSFTVQIIIFGKVFVNNGVNNFIKERISYAEQSAVAAGAADKAAKHISPAAV